MKVFESVSLWTGLAMMAMASGTAQASLQSVTCQLLENSSEGQHIANFTVSAHLSQISGEGIEYHIHFDRAPWAKPGNSTDVRAFRVVKIDDSLRIHAPRAKALSFATTKGGKSAFALDFLTSTKRVNNAQYYGQIGITSRASDINAPVGSFKWEVSYRWDCGLHNPFLN